jgi:hypothetical protein
VVAELTTTPPLPAEPTDAILDATDQELATAAAQLADDTRDWLERVGALKPSVSVLDLGHDHFMVSSAVYGILSSWWPQPALVDRSLSSVLKVVPSDVAESVMRLLRIGGFLPPEEAQPEE